MCAVLRADAHYWRAHPDLRAALVPIAEKALRLAAEWGEHEVCQALEKALVRYGSYPPQSPRTQGEATSPHPA